MRRPSSKQLTSLWTVAICCGLAAPAAGESRFHRLTPNFASHLSYGAQRAASAVAKFRHATAFVVAHDPQPTARALVLTNYHVAGQGVKAGESLRFLDRSKAKTVRLVNSNASLDYALIEVVLPWGSNAHALPLRPEAIVPSRKIYSVAGYANLHFNNPSQAVGGGPSAIEEIANGPQGSFAIAVGRLHDTNTMPMLMRFPNATVTTFQSVLPNSGGMSGSPVLARDTHAVIGLHTSGGGVPVAWQESAVPIGLILDDMRARRDSGAFDFNTTRLVNQLFLPAPSN